MSVVSIPGTPFIALADDKNLTPKAIAEGTIKLETYIAKCSAVQELGPHDLVLDVGAFIGDTALIFLDHTDRVMAFEPQPDAFHCLLHNSPTSINFNVAVGNGYDRVNLQNDPMDGNLGTRTVKKDDWGLKTLALDELELQDVALIKIDVEGCEAFVLEGALKTINQSKPKLLIEIYPEMLAKHGSTKEDIYAILDSLNYDHRAVIGNETEPRWDELCTPR